MKSLRLESPQIRNPSESSKPEMKLERIFLTINDLSVIFFNQQMLTIMSITDRIILIVALGRCANSAKGLIYGFVRKEID